jgi:DNA modification methylase
MQDMNEPLSLESLPDGLKQAVADNDLPMDVALKLTELNDPFINSKMIRIIERKKKYGRDLLKNAMAAVKKSKNMKNKMDALKKTTDSGIILSSVWNFGNRDNYAGDSNFHGNAPTQVVEQCILRLTTENDLVVDPMAGSGTTIDVGKAFNRKVKAFDLTPTRKEIIENDSRRIPMRSESVDLVFFHPPYMDMIKYSTKENDISRQRADEFLESMQKIIIELHRILKPNKYVCILIGDIVRKGKFIPLTRKIANIFEELGFEDCGNAIKITKDSVSQRRRGKAIYAELATTKNLKQNHDTVMFWKK